MKIETKQVELTTQYADEGCWLYQDQGESFRYFTKKVLLGAGAEPWHECTDEDKAAYEAEWAEQHPEEEGEVPTADPVAEASTQATAEEGAGV